MPKRIFFYIFESPLLLRIVIAIILAILVAFFLPALASKFKILGDLFIQVLKSIAPILVFTILSASIADHKHHVGKTIRFIFILYFVCTFLAALLSVVMSFAFPITLPIEINQAADIEKIQTISEVLISILTNMLDNPVKALYEGNYISILFWSILIGFCLTKASSSTKQFFHDISSSFSKIVSLIINFAPFGIFGILTSTLAVEGLGVLNQYMQVIILLVATMLLMAFVFNPLIVYLCTKKNPYPLVWMAAKTSGVTAFFTRSSVANIPVNLKICEELKVDKEVYSITIPLGATINMAGAAITITILTLATVHTLNQPIYFIVTFLLCFLASICAAGSSGVAGGSIMLIPVACNLFGIPSDIIGVVMQTGFVIGVIQDSMETALNSSSDVVLTVTGNDYMNR